MMPRIQIFLDSKKVLDVDPLYLLLLLSLRGEASCLPRAGTDLVLRIDAPPAPGNMGSGVTSYHCGKVPNLQDCDR